jgi:hypothetical protein
VSRTLSADALARFYASESPTVFCCLITLDHSSLATPLYLTNDTVDRVFGGHTYTHYPFEFDPPDESESTFTNAAITIDATDQTIAAIVLSLDTPPTITVKAVMVKVDDDYAIEQITEYPFSLYNCSGDVNNIRGELVFDTFMENAMGPIECSASLFPGLY